jgi:hypothetical protein
MQTHLHKNSDTPKTDVIDEEITNYAINGIWLFAGEGTLYQRKPLPQLGKLENIAINRLDISGVETSGFN